MPSTGCYPGSFNPLTVAHLAVDTLPGVHIDGEHVHALPDVGFGHGIALDAEGILRRGGVARIGGQGDAAGFRFLVLIVIGPEESRLGDPAEADAEGHSDVWRIAQIIRGAEEP